MSVTRTGPAPPPRTGPVGRLRLIDRGGPNLFPQHGVALPFAITLVANLLFTPIQFGLRNLPLAPADILVVWGTIVWMMRAVS